MLDWELCIWLSSLGWALSLVIRPNHLFETGYSLVNLFKTKFIYEQIKIYVYL